MSFLEPVLLLLFPVFSKKLVEVKATKYDKTNGYYDPEGGVLCTCEKGIDAVTSISQESNTKKKI